MKNISILGSTGSIGTQALEVVRQNKDIFNIVALSGNNNIDLLEKQVREFKPKYVAVYSSKKACELREKLQGLEIIVLEGMDGLVDICTIEEADIVLTSIVGTIGLLPTLNAIRKKKTIALANKETLVTAGSLVMKEAKNYGVDILPVDSEHSAIFQCLQGNSSKKIERIVLTASGGPFRGRSKENLANVSVNEALKHPNWSMGKKITIDSATLMNKGLEVIEAKWLFDIDINKIDVVVHPQSIIHSLVEYVDGSMIAQLGTPDMKLPIHYALNYPERKTFKGERLNLVKIQNLTFEEPDKTTFPCLELAYEALKIGGSMPAVLNAANEELVLKFLKGQIKFYDIPVWIERAMKNHRVITDPNIDDILEIDNLTREFIKIN